MLENVVLGDMRDTQLGAVWSPLDGTHIRVYKRGAEHKRHDGKLPRLPKLHVLLFKKHLHIYASLFHLY